MKPGSMIAYFDCFAGISGDMTLGALIDAGGDRAVLDAAVEALRLGDEVKIDVRHESRGHAGGTRILVGVAERVERTVPALRRVIEDSEAPDAVKSPALDAIDRLARAEAQVHNAPLEQAHLHELSGADTLVDVVGAFWLLHALDDMAPNLIAALTEDLMAAGALDVTVVPALMKKGRPGHVLTVMSPPELVARLSDHLLRHSTTLGLRLTPVQRVIAGRMVIEVTTPIGSARVKVKELDGKPVDVAPEYEDCRRIARERGIDLREVMRVVAESARRQVGLD